MTPQEQVARAYVRMATEARYRPAAPSDGLGTITVPEEELVLEDEVRTFVQRWMRREAEGVTVVGHPDHDSMGALVLTVEAAHLLCGSAEGYGTAAALLRMAAEESERLAARG